MFFTATRLGGRRSVRIVAGAVAWLDETEGCAAIHLIGGEVIRVCEGPDQIEALMSQKPQEPEEPAPAPAIVHQHNGGRPRHSRGRN